MQKTNVKRLKFPPLFLLYRKGAYYSHQSVHPTKLYLVTLLRIRKNPSNKYELYQLAALAMERVVS